MTPAQRILLVLGSGLAFGASVALAAADVPRAVSPGSAQQSTAIATPCPTFSWSLIAEAEGYELLVFRADQGERVDPEPVLERTFTGAVATWTPPLDACLRLDRSFAWTIRSRSAGGSSAFSEPLFFRTPAIPTAAELERAIKVLQRWRLAEEAASDALTLDDSKSADNRATSGARRRAPRSRVKSAGSPSIAIRGANPSTDGAALGVLGSSASALPGSAGVVGESTAPTGDVAGLIASHQSPQGAAVRLKALGGGELIRGIGPNGAVFSIDAQGHLAATTLTGDGSGISDVDAATLGGWLPNAFAPIAHFHAGGDIVTGTVAEPRIDAALARDAEVMPLVLANDGPGSGLDADTVDGVEASTLVTGGQTCSPGQIMIGLEADGSLACLALPINTFSVLDELGFVGADSSIAIGADGRPVISYIVETDGGHVRFAQCKDILCSASTTTTLDSVGIDVGLVGHNTSIVIGTDRLPVISYWDASNQDLKVAHCSDASCSSSTVTTLDSAGNVGSFNSIALGADGLPIISYFDASNGDLKVAHCQTRSCSSSTTTTVDSTGIVGQFTSIAIGADGLPVISYHDSSNQDLKVARCLDVPCTVSSKRTQDSSGTTGQYTSLAIGADGLPVISYYDGSNGDLKVAHCDDSSCSSRSTTTVDTAGTVGLATSIAIAADGLPIISYLDASNAQIKIAYCRNPSCSSSSRSDLGGRSSANALGTSIAIGTDGLPIFSYQGFPNRNLVVAHCANPSCS